MTTPEAIWELEVWSPPGHLLNPEFGKLVLAPEMWREGISRDVFLGLSAIPDPVDCENLKSDIESGVVTMQAFSTFCFEQGLVDSTDNQLSASRFLEYSYGRPLAWVHIPDAAAALDLASAINVLLAKRGLFLLEPFTHAVVFDAEGRALFGPTDHSKEWIEVNRIAKGP